jgi:hypothetical protein
VVAGKSNPLQNHVAAHTLSSLLSPCWNLFNDRLSTDVFPDDAELPKLATALQIKSSMESKFCCNSAVRNQFADYVENFSAEFLGDNDSWF